MDLETAIGARQSANSVIQGFHIVALREKAGMT